MPEKETSSLQESVAAEIRAQLARRRLSGRQAAVMLGWTSPYLSRRLTGEVPFDVADLEAMAGLLGVPVASFLQGPPAPVMLGLRRGPIRCPSSDVGSVLARPVTSWAAGYLAGREPGYRRPSLANLARFSLCRSSLGLAA